MEKENIIRVGLIGSIVSGKSHFIATLARAFWRKRHIKISPMDDATRNRIDEINKTIISDKTVLDPTMSGAHDFFRMNFQNDTGKGRHSFNYQVQILDISGEAFVHYPSFIFEKWLKFCNVIIFMIDGQKLLKKQQVEAETNRDEIFLFEKLKMEIIDRLAIIHRTKNRVLIPFCLTKCDLFAEERMPKPDAKRLVRTRFYELFDRVETVERQERQWAMVKWYGISSLGYVWDQNRPIKMESHPKMLLPQLEKVPGQVQGKLRKPQDIRPENIDRLFTDIANHAQRHKIEHDIDPPKLDTQEKIIKHFYREGQSLPSAKGKADFFADNE